jgi:hypothetical protein
MPQPPKQHASPNWFKARVSSWFWSLTPTCREVARLTSEQRDHPLPIGLRLRLSLHRSFCQWCARYAEQLDLIHDASHHFSEHMDEIGGPSLEDDAKARMKRALQRQISKE